ncbi:MAG: CRISPR-associated endonuclease Cas3'' [Candidatus Hodarchaeota archaeon]
MSLSFKLFKLKSHPNVLLINHLKNVGNLSKEILNSKTIENKNLFSEIAYIIGISHDFGKATPNFQKKLHTGEISQYANHAFLSSLFGYYLIKKYLTKKNILDLYWYLPVVSWVVINRHHGSIKNLKGYNSEISKLKDTREIIILQKQIELIKANNEEIRHIYYHFSYNEIDHFLKTDIVHLSKIIQSDVKRLCRENEFKYYFILLILYSVLLDADKIDASNINSIPIRFLKIDSQIIDNFKKARFGKAQKTIDKIREKAYTELVFQVNKLNLNENRILSINLPTGLGKTLSGMSFALKLRNRIMESKHFTPKIIYLLPFLSIIDQNSKVLTEVLKTYNRNIIPSNLLLKHHHLADIRYIEEIDEEGYNIVNLNQSLLLTEGWHSEIVITTFIQFFHSVITNRNRAVRKFNNIVNSIIVLDEIQSIPHKYWLLINNILKYLAQNFNCWIVLMTATLPLIFDKSEIKDLLKDPKEYFKIFDRVIFNFDLKETDLDTFNVNLLKLIKKENEKDIMVVLNTINSCKETYTFLKYKISHELGVDPKECIDTDGICNFGNIELINLSTHILPAFRLARINKIKQNTKRKIIITTQMIEAGVDISVDIVFRDFAPLDCIIQTAGRCNRNNSTEKGIINVITLKDKFNRRYCSYIYDSLLLDITREVIEQFNKSESESSFIFNASNKYYSLIKKRSSSDIAKELFNSLKILNFNDTRNFQLIEKKLDFKNIYIEIDKEAERVRKEIENLFGTAKNYNLKYKLLQYRKNINDYTLSIRCNEDMLLKLDRLPSFGKMKDFKYVPREILHDWYQLDTGFYT